MEIDEKLKISETFGTISTNVVNKAKEVDETWKISDNVNAAIHTVSSNVEAGFNKAKETPVVQSTTNTISQWGENINKNIVAPSLGALKANYENIQHQSNQIIEEKRRHRSHSGASETTPPVEPST